MHRFTRTGRNIGALMVLFSFAAIAIDRFITPPLFFLPLGGPLHDILQLGGLALVVGLWLLGRSAAERIFYRAMPRHLVKNSGFVDMRLTTVRSATELFGENSDQARRVDEAFAQVEVGAGATTPPPGSWPPVAGTDATLFICYDSDCGLDRLCRKDSSLGDAAEGVFLSQFDAGRSRPAVAGNGALAVFVDTFNDLCLIVVAGGATEECLGYQGSVFSAAVSRDGETLAFILLDAAGEPDSRINVADGAGNVTSYQLSLPA